jgi:hypothetical protein
LHHGCAGFRQRSETVGAHIMGDAESLTIYAFDIIPIQCLAWSKGNRMNDTVKTVPMFPQVIETLRDFVIIRNIAWKK